MHQNFKNPVSPDVLKATSQGIKNRMPLSESPYGPTQNGRFFGDTSEMDPFSSPEGVLVLLRGDSNLEGKFKILEEHGVLSGGDKPLSVDYSLGKKLPLFPLRYDSWGRFMREGRFVNYCPTPTEALALLNGEPVELPEVPEELESLMEDEYDLFLVLPSLEGESPEMLSLFWGDPVERAIVDSVEDISSNKYGIKFNTEISSGSGQKAFSNLATRLSSQTSSYVPWGVLNPCDDGESYKLDSDAVRMFEGRPSDSILHEVLPELSKAWEVHPLSISRPFLPGSINFGGHQIGVSVNSSEEFSIEDSINNFNVWFDDKQDFDKEYVDLGVYKLDGDKPVSQWDDRIFNSLLRRIEMSWATSLAQTGNLPTLMLIRDFLKSADKGNCKSAKEFFDDLSVRGEIPRTESVAAFKTKIHKVLDFEKKRQEFSHNPLGYSKDNSKSKLSCPMTVSYSVPVKKLSGQLRDSYTRTSFITQNVSHSKDQVASTSIDVKFSTSAEALRRGVCKPWKWPRNLNPSKDVTYVDLKDYLKNLPLSTYSLGLYLKDLEAKMDNNMVQFDAPMDSSELETVVRQVSRLKEASKAGLILGAEHPSVGVAHLFAGNVVPNSRIGVVRDLIEELESPIKGMDDKQFRNRVRNSFKDLEHIQDSLIYWNSPKDILGLEEPSKFLIEDSNLSLEVERWLLPLVDDKVAVSNLSKLYSTSDGLSQDFNKLKSEFNSVLNKITEYSDYSLISFEGSKNNDNSLTDLLDGLSNLNNTKQFFNVLKKFAIHSPSEHSISGNLDDSKMDSKLKDFVTFISTENSWKNTYSYLSALNDISPIVLNGVPFEYIKETLGGEEVGSIDLNTLSFEDLKNTFENDKNTSVVLESDSLKKNSTGLEISLNDVQIKDLDETLNNRSRLKDIQNLRLKLFNNFNQLFKLFKPVYDICPTLLTTEIGSKVNPRVLREISDMLITDVPLSDLCKPGGRLNSTFIDLNDLFIDFSEFENSYNSCVRLQEVSKSIVSTLEDSKQFKGLAIKSEGSKTIVGGLGGLYYKVLSEAYPKELGKLKFEFSDELGTKTGIYTNVQKNADFSSPESLNVGGTNTLTKLASDAEVQKPMHYNVQNPEVVNSLTR